MEKCGMKPSERRETDETDLFRSRREQIINMSHELVLVATTVSWGTLATHCGEVYRDGPGMARRESARQENEYCKELFFISGALSLVCDGEFQETIVNEMS